MPRPQRSTEKAKDFKGALKRLFKELKGFKKLTIFALIIACLSSVITIFTPNILSDLTDYISDGLVVNTDNLEAISKSIESQLTSEDVLNKLNIDLSEKNIQSILLNEEISIEDKTKFQEILSNMDSVETLASIPEDILDLIIKNSTYKEDIKEFINSYTISDSLAGVLFEEITIDGSVISTTDQASFLKVMSNMDSSDTTSIYESIEELPSSIRSLVEPFMNIKQIKHIALILIILYLISAIFTYVEAFCMTIVANKFARRLRSNISKKINKLPLKYFDKHAYGDTLSRVTNDVDTIAQSMNESLSTLVSAITLFLGTIIMMFITNSIMAITAILASLFGFIFMFIVLSKSQKYFIAKQRELGALDGHIEEVYSGLNVVKTYNGKYDALEKFDKLNNKLYNANWKSEFLSGLMPPMMGFIGNFGYVAVCIVGAMLTMNNQISFGVIIAFITYVRLFTSPLSQIAQAMTSMQSTAASSERVFEFIDEREMSNETKLTKVLKKEDVKGKIEFKNVNFTYEDNDTPTIKNFSATAIPGEKIAIVGPTGAGKTTMVNLLMKFYEIDGGDILIDDISTKELTRENIHDLFTMVLQDTWVFNGSIKENIIYNNENASDFDVHSVCKTVGLDHFIKTLPEGYDTILSDNDSISAGQKQLLTIARGMMQDTPFLILDEATSNVDTRTEELVQKAMDKLTEGRTSFIIAHRLSTIKNADLILVMKDGNIIETGNHEQLMKKGGFYADLYNSQFEL